MFIRLLGFLLVGLLFFSASEKEKYYYIKIEEGTSLVIKGSTSINRFQCISSYVPLEDTLHVIHHIDSGKYLFNKAKIIFRINEMECGDPYSNKQLRATLKGKKFPFILIEIMEIMPDPKHWINSTAKIKIELAGKVIVRIVNLKLAGAGNNVFSLEGEQAFLMSSFELSPPRPMMGLVQVRDSLDIKFFLSLRLLENKF
jgi:hypothetical protein